jgi:hypothetical protein
VSTYATEDLPKSSPERISKIGVNDRHCFDWLLSQKLISQSPVVEPVVAYVSCSNVLSVSSFAFLDKERLRRRVRIKTFIFNLRLLIYYFY